jgi:hypothetical protein
MADFHCPSCKHAIAAGATSCPNCRSVFPADLAIRGPLPSAAPAPPANSSPAGPTRVTISDLDIPIRAMTVFMVRWAIASIPALILIFLLVALASAILSVFLAGIGAALL